MKITLLTHAKEINKRSNTGKLVLEILGEAAEQLTWDRMNPPEALEHEIRRGKTALVFPGPADENCADLTDNIDLTVSSGYQSMNSRNSEAAYSEGGIIDTLLEIKWRFYDNGKGLGLAVKPALFLPTGNSDRGWGSGDYRFGIGEVRYRLNLVTSQDFKRAAFHVNLGYLRNENRYGARESLWHASLASELKLFRQLRLVANVGMDTAPDIGSSVDSVWALGGFIYSPTDALSFAVGLKHGFNDPGYDFAINSGVSYKF